MSEIKVTVQDMSATSKVDKLEKGVPRFVRKGAAYIEGEIKSSMAEPKHGKAYKRGSKVHIASAKGESPAVDSGNYIGSIEQIFPSSLEAVIGTNAAANGFPYPAHLENEMERPLWEKTAKEALPTLEKILRAEIGA
jgi:hypothetical protein